MAVGSMNMLRLYVTVLSTSPVYGTFSKPSLDSLSTIIGVDFVNDVTLG